MKQKQTLAEFSPQLAAQWHPTKNGTLSPGQVAAGSSKKVWWLGPCGHEWETRVSNRSNLHSGCPYCSTTNRRALPGIEDLATRRPDLAAQWHPTKNGSLTPDTVTSQSNRRIWWVCQQGHAWDAPIANRVRYNRGCPYCSGHRAVIGETDLETIAPDIAAQWHPTKNGELSPSQFTRGAAKIAWWLCPTCGHEWQASVFVRTNGVGCPQCRPEQLTKRLLNKRGSLLTNNPALAAQWHPTKNGALTPDQVLPKSGKKVWWLGPCGHEWQATVCNRANDDNCPYCAGKKILRGFNDLASQNSSLAAQWHPAKNGTLTPDQVTAKSGKKVWWLCPDCGHEWESTIANRAGGGCPQCHPEQRSKRLLESRGSLLANNPALAAQWHPTKNGVLTPDQVLPKSNKKVWWLCPDCGHQWEATVVARANGGGCPECSPQRKAKALVEKRGSLLTNNPALAAQWHPAKNGALTPDQVTAKSAKKVWWLCPDCGHQWEATPQSRAGSNNCPSCSRYRRKPGGGG